MNIGIIGPSSVVPQVELGLGIEKLCEAGMDIRLHPHCTKKEFLFSGSDRVRAESFFEFARADDLDLLWCARGGYGAGRILALLDKFTLMHGVPAKKLLVGFSDSTAILEYVRAKWGWSSLHAPMPATQGFQSLAGKDWKAILGLIQGEKVEPPALTKKLKFLNPGKSVQGEIVGGNLAVMSSLVGTPHALDTRDKILFIEELAEAPHRIDRMFQQMVQSGAIKKARAIVLGTFTDCEDSAPQVLVSRPKKWGKNMKFGPVRPQYSQLKVLSEIFGEVGKQIGIPVAYGLNVGHGTGRSPLPLGAEYELAVDGKLSLLKWGWTSRKVSVK